MTQNSTGVSFENKRDLIQHKQSIVKNRCKKQEVKFQEIRFPILLLR